MITSWKANDNIREKKTGKAFLVLHVYKNICTLVHDLSQPMGIAIVLLEKDYSEFAKDSDMKETEEGWAFEPPPNFQDGV